MADEGPREVHIRIERREGRRAERIAWIGAILVVLAIMKPWGSLGTPATADRPQFRATDKPAPTEDVVAPELPCIGGRWSIEADERWVGTVVRTWVLTDAVEALGPFDERIHFATVAAQQIISLGFCPPFHDAEPGVTVTIFRLDATEGVQIVDTVSVQMPKESEAMANVLYRPAPEPGASAGSNPMWQAGRYVLRIDAADSYRRWLGVDVRLISMPGDLASLPPPPS
jgi:hypothetical protein